MPRYLSDPSLSKRKKNSLGEDFEIMICFHRLLFLMTGVGREKGSSWCRVVGRETALFLLFVSGKLRPSKKGEREKKKKRAAAVEQAAEMMTI